MRYITLIALLTLSVSSPAETLDKDEIIETAKQYFNVKYEHESVKCGNTPTPAGELQCNLIMDNISAEEALCSKDKCHAK